jgi:sugar-phosphatase
MRAFLFDIDGTLVDSSASIERVWRQVAREFCVDEAEVLSNCHGRRDADVVEEFFKPEVREAVVARVNVLDTEFVNGAVPTLGAQQLLATLADGQWAAVTSGPRPLMAARLRAAGLPVPTVLITADDVRFGKPHPEGFLLAAAALGVPAASCAVVEDSPAGVAAGKAAGARVIAVTTTHPADVLSEADVVVNDLSDLLDLPASWAFSAGRPGGRRDAGGNRPGGLGPR